MSGLFEWRIHIFGALTFMQHDVLHRIGKEHMQVGCYAAYDVTEYILSRRSEDNTNREMRYMSLGSNICFLRKQKKYTQEQFAEKMGVTRQTISRWESDEVVPELAKLIEISDFFHAAF